MWYRWNDSFFLILNETSLLLFFTNYLRRFFTHKSTRFSPFLDIYLILKEKKKKKWFLSSKIWPIHNFSNFLLVPGTCIQGGSSSLGHLGRPNSAHRAHHRLLPGPGVPLRLPTVIAPVYQAPWTAGQGHCFVWCTTEADGQDTPWEGMSVKFLAIVFFFSYKKAGFFPEEENYGHRSMTFIRASIT